MGVSLPTYGLQVDHGCSWNRCCCFTHWAGSNLFPQLGAFFLATLHHPTGQRHQSDSRYLLVPVYPSQRLAIYCHRLLSCAHLRLDPFPQHRLEGITIQASEYLICVSMNRP